MKSDGNSFYGDVVLDSFNMSSRDEDRILDQMYLKGDILVSLLWRFKILEVIEGNAYFKKYST